MQYYQNNLLVRHKHTLGISITGLVLLALTVVSSIIWSFSLYRQATQHTYVFHQKGAAVAIYDERTHVPLTQALPARLNPYHYNR